VTVTVYEPIGVEHPAMIVKLGQELGQTRGKNQNCADAPMGSPEVVRDAPLEKPKIGVKLMVELALPPGAIVSKFGLAPRLKSGAGGHPLTIEAW
jgi:hypothetical protein